MVRVATLLRKVRAGAGQQRVDGMALSALLAAIRSRAARMTHDSAACWDERLRPALADHGVRFLEPDAYTEKTKRYLAAYFRSEIHPLLTPLAFDPGHPFPIISNRSSNFAVVVRVGRRTKFARVKIPQTLPRFVPIPGASAGHSGSDYTFAFLEDVIRANLGDLFPGVDVVGAHLFRVIRDTDVDVPSDGGDDLLAVVNRSLQKLRHAPRCSRWRRRCRAGC
jgi:polyphosphate kinase